MEVGPPPRLRRPEAADAAVVASWSRSADEARRWCSLAVHPFPPSEVISWWGAADVDPQVLLVGEEGRPEAYGELWLDEQENEVELARIIVRPARRRAGLGRELVTRLVEEARATGLRDCFLRVAPDNSAALGLYRSCGFVDVEEERSRAWNESQPRQFVWLERVDFGGAPCD
ncbi:MAG TPA: GNAT family N-acetyltransferase [Propionibacteriaceae bacterium]